MAGRRLGGPLGHRACVALGALSGRLGREGWTIGKIDEMIASIALCHDGIVVTKEERFCWLGMLGVVGY